MSVPDVKIRLSAEGVADVVSAFKKIESQAGKSGKNAARGIGAVNKALGGLTALAPAVGLGALVLGLRRAATASLDYADQIGKASQRTGAAVEVFSVLANAATTADIDQKKFEGSVAKLARTIDEAEGGNIEYAEGLDRIGLSAKDLAGLDTGTQFVKVAQSLGALEDGSTKTALALTLFGKSGAELLPLMNDLAGNGFEEARAKAESLGLVLSGETAAGAAAALDALTNLGNRMKGLALEASTGFAPQMATAIDGFTDSITGKGSGGLRSFGDLAGRVFRVVLGGLTLLGVEARFRFEIVKALIEGLITAAGRLLSLDYAGAGEAIATAGDRALALAEESTKRRAATLAGIKDAISGEAPKFTLGEGDRSGAPAAPVDTEANRAATTRLAALKASIDAETNLVKARQSLEEKSDKAAYDRGLLSLEEYYGKRRARLVELADQEIAALQQKRTAAAGAPAASDADRERNAAAVAAIDAEIERKSIERKTRGIQLAEEERTAALAVRGELLSTEARLLESQGRRHEALLLGLEEELAKYDALLARAGAGDEAREAAVAAARAIGESKIAFDELNQAAALELRKLATESAAIRQEQARGLISQAEASSRISTLELERLPTLQAIADQMAAIAASSGDPAAVQQAEELALVLGGIQVAADESGRALARARSTFEGEGASATKGFLGDILKQTKSVSQAFDDMAKRILDAWIDMLVEMAAQKLLQGGLDKLFGAAGGAGGGGGIGSIFGFAEGGRVRGPGTGTSDSILAALSNEEFVVRARAVRAPGVLAHLEAINRGAALPSLRRRSLPGYAAGGLVGRAATSTTFENRTVVAQLSADALGMTLREWFLDELAREESSL